MPWGECPGGLPAFLCLLPIWPGQGNDGKLPVAFAIHPRPKPSLPCWIHMLCHGRCWVPLVDVVAGLRRVQGLRGADHGRWTQMLCHGRCWLGLVEVVLDFCLCEGRWNSMLCHRRCFDCEGCDEVVLGLWRVQGLEGPSIACGGCLRCEGRQSCGRGGGCFGGESPTAAWCRCSGADGVVPRTVEFGPAPVCRKRSL